MKKYKIEDFISMLNFAEIQTFLIEELPFYIINREKLSYRGKSRKKEATEGELDIFAFYKNVIWLIEWTAENAINTKDFDTFKTKIEKLNTERHLLQDLIKKINQKFGTKINTSAKDARLIGLYINPLFTEVHVETIKGRLQKHHKELIYVWDCDTFEYFKVVCNTIRKFSKYELFSYFNITPDLIFSKIELEGRKSLTPYKAIRIKSGIFGHSTFTFKTSPSLLLERCYVLRNEGWRSDSFQRMVMPKKLVNIREYICKHKKTSFANNIIISPSPDIDSKKIIDENGSGDSCTIHIPFNFSSFCIIDGQHRLLAFTQDFYGQYKNKERENDNIIKQLSENSEIIVTLVNFSGSKDNILKEQATLFRDINSNQTRVKSDFLYNLQEIIEPLSDFSLANKLIKYLNSLEDGILKDKFEIKALPSYRGRIKRSSIVKWGLSELVSLQKPYFYSFIPDEIKRELKQGKFDKYIKFCGDKLEKYFRCIKDVFEEKYKKDVWDYWRRCDFMLLSTSSIVGFLRLYRHFIKDKTTTDESKMKKILKNIKVDFNRENYLYTSSQWAKLEASMFDNIITKQKKFGDKEIIKRSKK